MANTKPHQHTATTATAPSHFTQHPAYPWLIMAFAAIFLFYKYLLQVSPSVMTDQLMAVFHVNAAGLGNLAAMYFYAFLLMQIPAGILLDRYSPRWLTAAAIALCAIGTVIFASAHSFGLAAVARALIGIGITFATISYMKMTANWFKPEQFAFVGGLLATAAMLGAIFGQAPLAHAVNVYGWRDTLYGCAGAGLIVAIAYALVVRDRPITNQPNSVPADRVISWSLVLTALKNPQNLLLTFYSGLAFTPVAVFAGLWGNPFLEQVYQLPDTQAAFLISLMFIGLAIGSPLLGLLVQRQFRPLTIMKYCGLIAFILMALIIYNHQLSLWLLGSLLFLFGFTTSAFMLAFTIGRLINPLILAATVVSLINMGDAILGSITEPLIGKLLDLQWSGLMINGVHHFTMSAFRWAFVPILIYPLLGWLILFWVKESATKTA